MSSTSEAVDANAWQPVTAAQIFGIFLVLQFCLLTQPPGSLLNIRSGGWLWRCNPVSALVEALIIIRHLVGGMILLHSKPSKSRGASQEVLVTRGEHQVRLVSLKREFRHVVAAILTLRTEMSTEMNIGSSSIIPLQIAGTVQLTGHEASATIRSSRKKCSTMTPREWRIDAVTTLAALTITIKLFAMQGAILFKCLAFPIIFGWATLQAMLLIFHSHEMTDEDHETTSVLAAEISTRIKAELLCWRVLFFYSHMPLIFYLSYLRAWRTRDQHFTSGFSLALLVLKAVEIIVALRSLASIVYSIRRSIATRHSTATTGPGWSDMMADVLWGEQRDRWARTIVGIAALVVATWLTVIFFTIMICIRSSRILINNHNTSAQGNTFDAFLGRITPAHSMFQSIVVDLIIVRYAIRDANNPQHRNLYRFRLSLSNVGITLGVLTWYLLIHDQRKTLKPTWTDWLG